MNDFAPSDHSVDVSSGMPLDGGQAQGGEAAADSHRSSPVGLMALDDRGDFLETLQTILDESNGFRWLGSYTKPQPFLADVGSLRPDVILLDIDMPERDGIWVLQRLREANIEAPALMLSVIEDTDSIVRALEFGAQGYLVKSSTDQHLIWAIRDVLRGGAPISASIARRVLQRFVGGKPVEEHVVTEGEKSMEKLTPKEFETLKLLSSGMKYVEIAEAQGVKTDTVGTHVRHIYEKLKVRNRTEAALKYFKSRDRAQ